MANIRIILMVDTDKINSRNVNETCHLTDTTGLMQDSQNPTKFETTADSGSLIEWSGLALNHVDCVSIDSIVLEKKPGSYALFGVPVLIGSGGFIRATLIANLAEAQPDGNPKPVEETYRINFTVIKNNDGSVAVYNIDPKLRGNN